MPDPSADALMYFQEMTIATNALGGDLKSARYRLMAPESTKTKDKFPLILFLHGAGERGDDNRKQLLYLPDVLARPENRKRYAAYVAAPQCPVEMKWTDLDWRDKDSQAQPPLSGPMQMVESILKDLLSTWPIDASRIYLTGLSMGGYGSWDLALRRPEQFAALAPLCGGGDETQAAKLKSLPIWAVHGEKDPAVPVERSRRMIAAIEAAGGEPKYSELAGVGHNCWLKAYDPEFGLLDWMFEQRRS